MTAGRSSPTWSPKLNDSKAGRPAKATADAGAARPLIKAPTSGKASAHRGRNQEAGADGVSLSRVALGSKGFKNGSIYDGAPMLQRPHVLPVVRCHARRRWPVQPVNRSVLRWLKGAGSLTSRLRQLGRVEVKVLHQGTRRLWQAERAVIGQTHGHVREVMLYVDGQPLVWARSVTSLRALRGSWRALKGLGTRPLAALLFSHARVTREPLHWHAWRAHGPEQGRAWRQWLSAAQSSPGVTACLPPRWARASVFWHQGQALRVLESFSPQAQGHFTP